MLELTIKEQVYQFNFGIGFVREINKKVGRPIDGVPDLKENIGLQYYVGGMFDKNVEMLVDVLDVANKGQNPRVTRALIDSHIDDENTDIFALFDDVIEGLKSANASKTITLEMEKAVEEKKAAMEAR